MVRVRKRLEFSVLRIQFRGGVYTELFLDFYALSPNRSAKNVQYSGERDGKQAGAVCILPQKYCGNRLPAGGRVLMSLSRPGLPSPSTPVENDKRESNHPRGVPYATPGP